MLKRGKKAQLTLFIIVGLLILAVFVIYLVVQRTVIEDRTAAAQRIVEQVPTEFVAIQSYTSDCLAVVSERGLVRLGQQGGYIRPLEWHSLNVNEENPTDADGIGFGDNIFVPYWLFNDAANRANVIELVTLKPTEDQMEAELERWIEEEIAFCLDNYNAFDEQGFSVEQGETTATVSIVPGKVNVQMTHDITASRDGRSTEMEQFYHELNVDLFQMLDVANKIYDAQEEFSFLEEHMLSMMTLFSGTTTDDLPPMSETTFDFANVVVWQVPDVVDKIKLILTNYISMIQYQNSLNFFPYRVPGNERYQATKQRVYDNMMLPLTGADNFEVRFDYLNIWEPYFDANARSGIITPHSTAISMFGINFGTQDFRTTYDISFPVWVQLSDPSALNQRGFAFNFGLEGNVRNNRRVESDQVLPVPLGGGQSLLCNLNQRDSGEITVTIRDSYTQRPVPEALVTYVLGEDTCIIGETDRAGRLVAHFPTQIGGVVHASAVNYLGSSTYFNAEEEVDDTVEFEVHPLKNIPLTIKKKKVLKCGAHGCHTATFGSDPLQVPTGEGWQFSNVPVNLKVNEQALLTLTRRSQFDDPFTFVTAIKGPNSKRVRIPAGEYNMAIQIMLQEEVIIPEQTICEDVDVAGISVDEECYTIDEILFEQFPQGGLFLDDAHPIIIDEQLYGAEELVVLAVSPAVTDIPQASRSITDVEQINKVEEYSLEFFNELQPTYQTQRFGQFRTG